jgi:N-methylhydantoinase B
VEADATDDVVAAPDPVLLEVMKGEFLTVVEEMCAVIGRTARSFGARDGGDYTGAVIHPNGQVVARAGVSAWYVGNSVPFVLDKFGDSFKPGDIVIHNDPYSGGTHLPDIVLLMPVFHGTQLIAYVGNSVHHTDLGGFAPGGMSAKPTELFQEGLLLPRVLLFDGGQPVTQVFEIIKANTRSPVDVIGDLESQVAGCITAGRDIERLVLRYGSQTLLDYGRHIVSYSEQAVRNAIRSIPDGRYTAHMDASGEDDLPPIRVVLTVEVDGDVMTCDFGGTDNQSPSAVNVPPSTVAGNLLGNFHELFGIDVPANSGLLTPIRVVAPEGTVVNPRPPAAVGARSTITNKLSDLLLNALARAMPDRVRAEGPPPQMIVFTPDSEDGTTDEMLFDLWLAGTGARPSLDGLDGPVGFRRILGETMERDARVVLEGYGMVPDSGGPGRFRGGLAIYRQWRFLSPGRLWLRHLYAGKKPQGRLGGHPGAASVLLATVGGEVVDYSDRYGGLIRVQPGDVLYQASAGGGGHGDPFERDPQKIAADVLDEKVSRQAADTEYGVVLFDDLQVDEAATKRRRQGARSVLRATTD